MLCVAYFFLLVTIAQICRADVLLNLTPSTLQTMPGGVVTFTGDLTNNNPFDVFLNGETSSLLYPDLAVDPTPFFTDTPLSLAANGGSYSGALFNVQVDPAAASAAYFGSFTVQGGADSNTYDNLVTVDFEVEVGSQPSQTAPEPETLALAAIAILAEVLRRRLSARLGR